MNSDKCENLLGWGIGAFWLTACIAVGVGIEIDDHQERMHNKRAATEIKREVPPSSSTGGEIKGGEPTVYECISKSDPRRSYVVVVGKGVPGFTKPAP